jgi:hypothetical protein
MDPKRTLSEISHLFLSEMRERQSTGSATAPTGRPARIPPGKIQDHAQPHAQDHAQVHVKHKNPQLEIIHEPLPAAPESDSRDALAENRPISDSRPAPDTRPVPTTAAATAQVSVVLASHLADHPAEKIRQYARQLAAQCGRIGLIESDAAEFGITCLESHGSDGAAPGDAPIVIDELDGRRMSETLAELSFDVDRWIIALPNPRTTEAREVLRLAPHWVLLTTSDHDGVVATYRALKGLAELGKRETAGNRGDSSALRGDGSAHRPRLSLVVLDAKDETHANAVFRKLDAVSRQFLACAMESEAPVRPVNNVAENVLLHCRATRDKAQLATAPQWKIVTKFLDAAVAPPADVRKANEMNANSEAGVTHEIDEIEANSAMNANSEADMTQVSHGSGTRISGSAMHGSAMHGSAMPGSVSHGHHANHVSQRSQRSVSPGFASSPRLAMEEETIDEVLDLPDDSGIEAILEAVVRQGGAAGAWVQCPLKPPSCPQAILAVGRDQRLVLLAVAGRGLSELRSIGPALRWMEENRELIHMALPQLAIDPTAAPEVRLLVDHADLTADLLQPLLQSGTVRVQAYRKVKWGAKTGLLLEAA